jgi:hypothetical protein
MSVSERGAGQDVQFQGILLLIQDLSKISAAVAPESSMVGKQETRAEQRVVQEG